MRTEWKVLILSIAAGLLVWLADLVLDALYLGADGQWVRSLILGSSAQHAIHRFLILASFVALGTIASVVLAGRRRAEETVRASEAKYRAIFDAANDAILLHDKETGAVIDVNQKLCEWLGITREEALRLSVQAFALDEPPYTHEDAQRWGSKAVDEGPQCFEWMAKGKDGRLIWVDVNLRRVLIGDRERLLSVSRDISERKRAEEALRESEEKYRDLVETSQHLIWRCDATGRFTYLNPAWERTHGYGVEEMLGRRFTEFQTPEVAARDFDGFCRILEGAEATGHETMYLSKSGGVVHLVFNAIPLLDAEGNIVGTQGTAYDITERKRAEEALQKAHDELEMRVKERTADLASANERLRREIAVRTRAEKALHHRTRELGRRVRELNCLYGISSLVERPGISLEQVLQGTADLVPSAWQCAEAACARITLDGREHSTKNFQESSQRHVCDILVRGEPVGALEVGFREADHAPECEERPFQIEDLSLMNAIAGRLGQIAEGRRLEEQLRQAQKLESLGRLAGGVAHDLGNILTAMTGHADLALSVLPRAHPARTDLQGIQDSIGRAARLSQHLLAFARRQVVEPKILCLNDLILDSAETLRRLLREDIDLATSFAPGLWPVRVDPGQMEQVIINLAVNARDSMPSGGKLTIATGNATLGSDYADGGWGPKGGECVVVTVSDTGVGMSEEVKEHIFEPFFTTKPDGKGTGLGLATSYGSIRQIGGDIVVESEPGGGTTFKIILPRAEEAPGSRPDRAECGEAPGGTERVLLVEDDASVRRLTARALRERGYAVLEAADGEEALRVAQEQAGDRIDVLLTDVVMPRMNGKKLADRLSGLRPDTKVLFMSGYPDSVIAHHGVLEDGVAFLQKPFSSAVLARKLRHVLDGEESPSPRARAA